MYFENNNIILFNTFFEQYGDAINCILDESISTKITIVSPEHAYAKNYILELTSIYFATNPDLAQKFIVYHEDNCKKINLLERERYAMIAHEIGHIFAASRDLNSLCNEINADKMACEIGLRIDLCSGLQKVIDSNNQQKMKKQIIQRISLLSDNTWDLSLDHIKLAGCELFKRSMDSLPEERQTDIKKNVCSSNILSTNNYYSRHSCHNNAILAAQEIKGKGVEIKIIEGVVLCEDGFLFEHFWNACIFDGERSDFDVTIDVIGSDIEKNTKKTYYEWKTFTLSEGIKRKTESAKAFSEDIHKIVSAYYALYPSQRARYDITKAKLDGLDDSDNN